MSELAEIKSLLEKIDGRLQRVEDTEAIRRRFRRSGADFVVPAQISSFRRRPEPTYYLVSKVINPALSGYCLIRESRSPGV